MIHNGFCLRSLNQTWAEKPHPDDRKLRDTSHAGLRKSTSTGMVVNVILISSVAR
jgi:hypothetical protein